MTRRLDMRLGLRDPTIRSQVVALIRDGLPVDTAARSVGIAPSTVRRWVDAGMARAVRRDDGEDLGEWSEEERFAAEVGAALASAEADMLGAVRGAALDDWRAGAWWLERVRPDLYGAKSAVQVGGEVRVEAGDLDLVLSRLDAAIQALGEGGGDGGSGSTGA